jgi:hypothetical protein
VRTLLAIALFLTSSLPLMAEIAADGLPEGAAVLLHFSNTSLAQTQLGEVIQQSFADKTFAIPEAKAIEEKLGFNPLQDLKEVVAGLYRDNHASKNKTKAVILLRGKFDLKKLATLSDRTSAPCSPVESYSSWDMAEVVAAINNESPSKADRGKLMLVAFADDCLFLASPELIKPTLSCLQKKTLSYPIPLAITALNLANEKPWLVFYTDFSKIRAKGFLGEMGEKGMQQTLITVNESGRNIQLRGESEFTTPEQAEAATQAFKKMIKVTSLVLMSQKFTFTQTNPSDNYLLDLLNCLTVSRVGYLTKISGNLPTVKAAQAIRAMARESQNEKSSRTAASGTSSSE